MPRLSDFLQRFRPAGAPGAARAAVPADPAWLLAAELDPVLRLLDGTAAECAAILAQARDEAASILVRARADATAAEAAAHARAAEVRAAAVRQALAEARDDAEDRIAAATLEAGQIRVLAERRAPALTARAVALIRHLPASLPVGSFG